MVTYAFVPHFCRHEGTEVSSNPPEILSDVKYPPVHSLGSRIDKVVQISRSYCKRHLLFGDHHLDDGGIWLVIDNLAIL